MDIERFKNSLKSLDVDELEVIFSAVNDVLSPRRRMRSSQVKNLPIHSKVQVARAGRRLKKGQIGTLLQARRTKATVEFDGAQWSVPLDMLAPAPQ